MLATGQCMPGLKSSVLPCVVNNLSCKINDWHVYTYLIYPSDSLPICIFLNLRCFFLKHLSQSSAVYCLSHVAGDHKPPWQSFVWWTHVPVPLGASVWLSKLIGQAWTSPTLARRMVPVSCIFKVYIWKMGLKLWSLKMLLDVCSSCGQLPEYSKT